MVRLRIETITYKSVVRKKWNKKTIKECNQLQARFGVASVIKHTDIAAVKHMYSLIGKIIPLKL